MNIPIRTHETYKQVHNIIDTFLGETDENPADYQRLIAWVISHYYHSDIKPWNEFTDNEVRDPEYREYPNDIFLVALTENKPEPTLENWERLVSLISDAWYCISSDDIEYDEETETLTLYTFGWSGNEDIIYALHQNIYSFAGNLTQDKNCCAVWHLKKPVWLKK